jgi:leucyl/phenylalanyl-tRNA---protein transferase
MMRKQRFEFPDARTADATGLVAVSDHLDADLVLEAYSRGIFPWSEHPVRWYSPEPRAIFLRDLVRLPRRLGRLMRKERLTVTFDEAFDAVVRACAKAHLDDGEWITGGFIAAYGELHRRGFAHSVEVWQDGALAGGLYGVQLGGLFSGESMFYRAPNASKVAFAHLIGQLDLIGTLLVDCQVINDHTARLGAVCIRRRDYLRMLALCLRIECRYAGARWPKDPPPPPTRVAAADSEDEGERENS